MKANKINTRVHTFGIGDGVSTELIKDVAYAGDGSFYFSINEEELKEKII